MAIPTITMPLLVLLLVVAIGLPAVSGQTRYCDSSYVSVNVACCTPQSVMPFIGHCCLPSTSDCRCNRALMNNEERWAQCTGNFVPTVVAPPPPTPPPTAAPTNAPVFTTLTPSPTTATPSTTSTERTTPSTTRTSTTTTNTLPPTPRYCPSVPSAVSARLVNGYRVGDVCLHNGMIALNMDLPTATGVSKVTFCNAVVVYNSNTARREMVMDQICWNLLDSLEQGNNKPYATSQGVNFPISTSWLLFSQNRTVSSTLTNHTVAVPTVLMSKFLDSLVSTCDNTACVFNPSMISALSQTSCFLLSYGSSGISASNVDLGYDGLIRVTATIVSLASCGITSMPPDIICVRLTAPTGTCIGDTSAGLFCPLTTGETVFMGVTGFTNPDNCNGQTMYVPVSSKLTQQ